MLRCYMLPCSIKEQTKEKKTKQKKKRAIILYINHLFIFLIPAGFIVSISADDLYYVMVSRIKGFLLHILLGVSKKGFSLLLYDTSTKVKIPDIIIFFSFCLFNLHVFIIDHKSFVVYIWFHSIR